MTAQPPNQPFARILIALGLFLLALVPRVAGLADFLTTDEAYHWIDRTARFSEAIAQRRWIGTLQTGHPGVTLMWLGSLGQALERWRGASGDPDPLAHLAWLRLPSATFEALLIPLAYLLLVKLLGHRSALFGAALWATSPYLIAHSRLLHLDALLTAFVTFSVMLLAGACWLSRRRLMLVGSGLCAGLALLTKGPALILLPFAGLLLLALSWQAELATDIAGDTAAKRARRVARVVAVRYLVWLGLALLVVAALWPALWADPGRALARYVGEISDNGGRPNGDGQFFFGQAVADPGPLFYPVADLFRMTPVMMVGLAGLPLALRHDPAGRPRRRMMLVLCALALFWTFVMTLGPKKFDRYVLPAWPALLILSGSGLAALAGWLAAQVSAAQRALIHGLIVAVVLACEIGQLAWYHPYYLSYYNPVLGGGRAAQRTLLIGWGEGMDQVGAYLRSRPDLGYGPVLSALGATLQPFVPVDVRSVEDFGTLPANYAVVYLESVQRAANPALYAALQTTVPLRRITIHGIDYALIYQLPRPFARPLEANFGEALRLRGVTIERSDRRVVVTPAWDVRAAPGADLHVFVHLIDARGVRVGQIDVAPGGGEAPSTSNWQPGQQIAVPLPIDLQAALPPGEYDLVLGLYDPASGARLALQGGTAADPARAGANALLLEHITTP
jgi:4-amino-4-deoxy-L-arabinose transferase-like glycosyltransferase